MRRTEMKVSFIVPVYNSEKYLERCLGSILASTYKDIEIIVVDDGSTDSSPDIIKRFAEKDSRIRSYRKENEGPSEARNFGLEKVTGEYVWFVDSDDWIDPEGIAYCIKYMNSGYDIIMFDFFRYYKKRKRRSNILSRRNISANGNKKYELIRKMIGPVGDDVRKPYAFEDFSSVCSKIYKTELIKCLKFNSLKYITGEDMIFNLQAFLLAHKVEYIPYGLYFYNKKNDISVTTLYSKDEIVKRFRQFRYIQNFIYENNLNEQAFLALNNRKVISMLGFTRNIVRSDLTRSKKYEELQKIFDDKEYMKAFESFDYSYLPLIWRIFYKSAAKKRTGIVLLMGEAMEQARKILYYK